VRVAYVWLCFTSNMLPNEIQDLLTVFDPLSEAQLLVPARIFPPARPCTVPGSVMLPAKQSPRLLQGLEQPFSFLCILSKCSLKSRLISPLQFSRVIFLSCLQQSCRFLPLQHKKGLQGGHHCQRKGPKSGVILIPKGCNIAIARAMGRNHHKYA